MHAFKWTAVSLALVAGSLVTPATWAAEEKAAGFISVNASQIKWADAPSVGPGAKIAVLEGDLKKAEPFTMRLRLPRDLKIGVHTHPAVERVTVLSGSLYFAIGDKYDTGKAREYKSGDAFVVPVGMPMYAFTKKQETVIQIHGTGPWGISYMEAGAAPKKK